MKETKKEKGKLRDRCGDCYYNGGCTLPLNQCYFIKHERKTKVS